jgi:hypothetical protein
MLHRNGFNLVFDIYNNINSILICIMYYVCDMYNSEHNSIIQYL